MKTLVLLDTHALIHRAYHALPKFTSPKTGEPTGALYGLSAMLLKVIRELKPDYIAAAYDLPKPTFRHKEYKEYKANRKELESDLITQIERSKDLINAFGIPIISLEGFEADDILGTIAEQAKKISKTDRPKVIIVSGDMDTLQLVDGSSVVVFTLRKGLKDTIIYDEKKVVERFGFLPEYLPDFKGLNGDSSDNIKGVPGVGEKTATDAIKNFQNLENLFENLKKGNLKKLKEKTAQLLLKHEEDALMSKKLATIYRDVPVKLDLPQCKLDIKKDKAKNIFIELGFTTLISRLGAEDSEHKFLKKQGEELQATELIHATEERFLSDIERFGDEIYLYKNSKDTNFFIKGKSEIWVFEEHIFRRYKKEWQDLLQRKTLVTFSAKEIINLFKKCGIKPEKYFDCRVAAWVTESTLKVSSLEELHFHYFGKDIFNSPEEIVNKLPDLFVKLQKHLKERDVESIFYNIETPLVFILAKMEERGIKVDAVFLNDFKKELSDKLNTIVGEIYKAAGREFNINSPQQVGVLLFDELKIKPLKGTGAKKTKTGKYSTEEKELLKLKEQHIIISLILEYREFAKLLGTYAEPLIELSKVDGRIHTTFNQTGTVTGRLSSESPNLQNIPIRTEQGAKIRKAFVASPGYTLAAFDYSQIEFKILAVLAKANKLIKAFNDGVDIHTFTAASINNIPLEKVTVQMRRRAKTINFGIIYGMGIRQLSQGIELSIKDTEKFYKEYFNDFPEIKEYIENIKKSVQEKGYVETVFGRKRFLAIKEVRSAYQKAEMERMAVNAVIQGTDADVAKKAMIEIDRKFKEIYPLIQIHDELVYEIPNDIINISVPQIKEIMEQVVDFPVTLTVEAKTGSNLGNLKSFNYRK